MADILGIMEWSFAIIITSMANGGKGTVAGFLSRHLQVGVLPMGDLLKAEIKEGRISLDLQAEMAKGGLAPDDKVIELTSPKLEEARANRRSLIIEGLPRTLAQARYFSGRLGEIYGRNLLQIQLLTPLEECERRRALRYEKLGRSDDLPEAFQNRVAVYCRETIPAINHLEASGIRTIRVPVGWNEDPVEVQQRVLALTGI